MSEAPLVPIEDQKSIEKYLKHLPEHVKIIQSKEGMYEVQLDFKSEQETEQALDLLLNPQNNLSPNPTDPHSDPPNARKQSQKNKKSKKNKKKKQPSPPISQFVAQPTTKTSNTKSGSGGISGGTERSGNKENQYKSHQELLPSYLTRTWSPPLERFQYHLNQDWKRTSQLDLHRELPIVWCHGMYVEVKCFMSTNPDFVWVVKQR